MNATDAVKQLAGLLALPDQASPGVAPSVANPVATKAAILALAQSAGLSTTSFVDGDPGERFLEISARAQAAWGVVPTMAVRSKFLALATDPGDVDDFGTPDQSADQTPRPGFLSAHGLSDYGVQRGEQTYATSFVTITNTGSSATKPIAPGRLTFGQSGTVRSDGGSPTYVSVDDPTIYTGAGGTLTLGAGASVTIPVIAQQPGAYGSAVLDAIDECITQSYGTIAVNASTTAIGQERQARAEYIAECLAVADARAAGGPVNAFVTACTRQIDPTTGEYVPLQRWTGEGPTNITSVYVSPSSATGQVTIYVAGPAGPVDDVDVSSANGNMWGIKIADSHGTIWNPSPLGIVPATASPGPLSSDPKTGAPGPQSCVATTIAIYGFTKARSASVGNLAVGTYVTSWKPSTPYAAGHIVFHSGNAYACSVAGTSASSGGPTGTGTGITDGTATWNHVASPPGLLVAMPDDLQTTVASALASYLLSTGLGGVDQVAGAGVIHQADVGGALYGAHPGFYSATTTILPAPQTSVAIAVGHIAVAGTITFTLVVVA